MTHKSYISLIYAELNACKHFGHEYFCEIIFLVEHKTSQSCESALFFISPQVLLMTIVNLNFL